MKRLFLKYKTNRLIYNSIETKLYNYTHSIFFVFPSVKLRNFCVNTFYSKNINKTYHFSNKYLKTIARNGLIFGFQKHSF